MQSQATSNVYQIFVYEMPAPIAVFCDYVD